VILEIENVNRVANQPLRIELQLGVVINKRKDAAVVERI
jgi:hypothetical protein